MVYLNPDENKPYGASRLLSSSSLSARSGQPEAMNEDLLAEKAKKNEIILSLQTKNAERNKKVRNFISFLSFHCFATEI